MDFHRDLIFPAGGHERLCQDRQLDHALIEKPDVLKIARANYHVVLGHELAVKSLMGNLTGYNRDLQLKEEPLFASLETTFQTVRIMTRVVGGLSVDQERCTEAMTEELYATEEAYKLVKEGMPFRDAYRRIGERFSGGE